MYHKYQVKERSSTWVMVSASKAARLGVDRYIKSSKLPTTLNPFDIHLILLDTALAKWRPYIVYLTEQVMNQVRKHSRDSAISTFTHIRISQIR